MAYALIATAGIALLSLVGAALMGSKTAAERMGRHILPIAAGTFLSVAFFELIPESLHASAWGSYAIAAGFLFFYALAHLLRTYHHHHDDHCEDESTRAAASLVLVGDAIHNFADGIVIAAAFMVDPAVGIAATVGIALHEIPQEIAEYAILLRAGYSPVRAALFNLLSASSVILGAMVAFASLAYAQGLLGILIGIAAGNLLYIAASDIIPDLREAHVQHGSFWRSFIITVLAMALMGSLLHYTHEKFEHVPDDEEVGSENMELPQVEEYAA
jgi:zinc and cadmium transporter